jgi:hypothetical protein
MNDGKTPTFFYYASQVARKYGIGSIMKCNSDSGIFFDKLPQFKDTQLPLTTRDACIGIGACKQGDLEIR